MDSLCVADGCLAPARGVPTLAGMTAHALTNDGPVTRVLRYDLPASLVVFLVALPLSLGIAVASDAPVLAGVIAAIVGGVVAGALGGSPLQVSGPAAGLTVIVAGFVAEFGWAVTCAITVCAGVLQIVFGLTKLGRIALAVSPMVVHAMLAGIGITIALQQVHVLLGGESHSSVWHNIAHLPVHIAEANPAGIALGALVIAIMVGWRWAPAPLRVVPGPLIAIVTATVLSIVLALDVTRIELNGSLIDALSLPSLPDGAWGAFAAGVLTMALIASVESLLTAVAVDRMQTRTRSDLDRELVGQGAANMVSGAVGGLPITGVIVRSSANVAAGARTRASTVLHGVWILVFALPFAGLVEKIPTAALAGLLVVIGVQLVKLTHITTARRNGGVAVYLVTLTGVVFLNLLEGVLLGLALSIMMTAWRVARARISAKPTADGDWQVRITGSATCLSLPRLHQTLSSVPAGTPVTLVLSTTFVDHAAREYISAWQRQHEATGGRVHIVDSCDVDSCDHDAAEPTPPPVVETSTAPSGGRAVARTEANGRAVARTDARTEALVITCTDPGIRPAEITGSPVRDLFIARNIGNLVPAGRLDPSTEAAIAMAVEKLRVSTIVVCGHSGCSAMQALLGNPSSTHQRTPADEHLASWLAHAETSRAAFRGGRHPLAQSAAEKGFSRADQLAIVNVAVQTEIVAQHPLVRERHRRGDLDIIGLFYDADHNRVLHVTPAWVRGGASDATCPPLTSYATGSNVLAHSLNGS